MAVSPRLIRRRIRSVQNTKKITKAMELVAAAKMRRAVAATLKSRAYANLAWEMVTSLQGVVAEETHPLLRTPIGVEQRQQLHGEGDLYVVMASDRGLCGGFNAALFRELTRDVRVRHPEERSDEGSGAIPEAVRFIAVGKKAEQFIRRQGWELIASFTDISVAPTVAEVRPIAKIAIDAFMQEEVHRVRIAFTDFISSLRQQPCVRTLLPLRRFTELGPHAATSPIGHPPLDIPTEFLFRPDAKAILDAMLPRLVELQIYQAYLDSGASEHSARMLAMRNASDSARDMIDGLTLTFNRARQAAITQEISEISAGRAAMSAAQ